MTFRFACDDIYYRYPACTGLVDDRDLRNSGFLMLDPQSSLVASELCLSPPTCFGLSTVNRVTINREQSGVVTEGNHFLPGLNVTVFMSGTIRCGFGRGEGDPRSKVKGASPHDCIWQRVDILYDGFGQLRPDSSTSRVERWAWKTEARICFASWLFSVTETRSLRRI
ncbi:hypothetical protein BKA83DRAFT_4262941 [Pisolithus microcarpus]|nr:hypothetical protein BKA83DRAFT_4262941 [Pisolithus microcarpus]